MNVQEWTSLMVSHRGEPNLSKSIITLLRQSSYPDSQKLSCQVMIREKSVDIHLLMILCMHETLFIPIMYIS